MSEKTELLNPERVNEIAARRAKVERDNWQEVEPVDHEGCAVWPWEHEEDMKFAYAAPADVAALLADRAAFRALVAEELAKALPMEPTINSDCADDWEMGMAHAASAQRRGILAAATRLGIDLTPASPTS